MTTNEELVNGQQQQQHLHHHHHHSRLTRFLSRFTINPTTHSKRKSSLPNLNNNSNNQTNKQRSLSSNPIRLQDNVSLQPLLPLPTINDLNRSHSTTSESFTNPINHHGGADPNASIRPITPSSKAISISLPSPSETNHSRLNQNHLSLTNDNHNNNNNNNNSSSSNSNNSSEDSHSNSGIPIDDSKSLFGNVSLASTKPTTVISLENHPPTNRIAQPHHHPNSPITNPHQHSTSTMAQPAHNHHQHHHHHHHTRNSIRNTILSHQNHQRLQSASSSLNQSPLQQQQQQQQQPNTPTLTLYSSPPISPNNHLSSIINVPSHSLPHPSQNPHPAALADNASILTLASSGFAPSLHYHQNFPSDEDASVRALAPSRRESIESLSSRWSNVKSTRTAGSIRTSATGFYIGIGTSAQNDSSLLPSDPPPPLHTPDQTSIILSSELSHHIPPEQDIDPSQPTFELPTSPTEIYQ